MMPNFWHLPIKPILKIQSPQSELTPRRLTLSYLIKSFSSDKNELVPFSLHSEAADRDRPRPLEAAGRAKNRLFSLVEEAEWVVTGDADLKIPKWSVLLFRGNKPAEDLCLLAALVSPPVGVASDSRGLCWTLKIWKNL